MSTIIKHVLAFLKVVAIKVCVYTWVPIVLIGRWVPASVIVNLCIAIGFAAYFLSWPLALAMFVAMSALDIAINRHQLRSRLVALIRSK